MMSNFLAYAYKLKAHGFRAKFNFEDYDVGEANLTTLFVYHLQPTNFGAF